MVRPTRSGSSGGSGARGEAVIGRTTRVRGRVSGEGDLRIEGSIEGDILVGGSLFLAAGGRAASTIEADAVTVQGELEGDVRARGTVTIESGARVRGDIQGESFALEDGAEFVGRIDAEFDLPAELGSSGARSSGRHR